MVSDHTYFRKYFFSNTLYLIDGATQMQCGSERMSGYLHAQVMTIASQYHGDRLLKSQIPKSLAWYAYAWKGLVPLVPGQGELLGCSGQSVVSKSEPYEYVSTPLYIRMQYTHTYSSNGQLVSPYLYV